jgi:hypothetical protein
MIVGPSAIEEISGKLVPKECLEAGPSRLPIFFCGGFFNGRTQVVQSALGVT